MIPNPKEKNDRTEEAESAKGESGVRDLAKPGLAGSKTRLEIESAIVDLILSIVPERRLCANGQRTPAAISAISESVLDSTFRCLYFLTMIALVGTSGFQYPAWRGTFYPEKFPPAKMLSFYAERFLTTEINYTFYRIPNGKTMGAWESATPENFRFGLKAPQKVTHIAKLRNCEELMGIFQRVISGLGSKLGPVLFQLPPTFKKDAALLNEFLGSLSGGIRVAFEFRHGSWLDDEIFAHLQDHKAALCIAETSDLATPGMATTDFGYLRLRREDYEQEDIVRWAKFLETQEKHWSHAFVYFKHEESGIGPRLATRLMKELGGEFGGELLRS